MPYRARSSTANRPGRMAEDKSFDIPACFPRRKDVIFVDWSSSSYHEISLRSWKYSSCRVRPWNAEACFVIDTSGRSSLVLPSFLSLSSGNVTSEQFMDQFHLSHFIYRQLIVLAVNIIRIIIFIIANKVNSVHLSATTLQFPPSCAPYPHQLLLTYFQHLPRQKR